MVTENSTRARMVESMPFAQLKQGKRRRRNTANTLVRFGQLCALLEWFDATALAAALNLPMQVGVDGRPVLVIPEAFR